MVDADRHAAHVHDVAERAEFLALPAADWTGEDLEFELFLAASVRAGGLWIEEKVDAYR